MQNLIKMDGTCAANNWLQGTENYNIHTSRGQRSQDAQGKDGMINGAKTGTAA